MVTQPKPCPWCGAQPKLRQVVENAVWSVKCGGELSHLAYSMSWKSQDDAVRIWNDRPQVSA